MNNLNDLVQAQPNSLLSTLDQYEITILQIFLEKTNNNYLESADMWLNASASSTAKFGGNTGLGKLYRDKVVKEIEKFFYCCPVKISNIPRNCMIIFNLQHIYVIGGLEIFT